MSPYLAAPLVAWLVAQVLKYFLNSHKVKPKDRTKLLYATGGMPSSHTAIVVALLVSVGAGEGVESAAFAIAAALALIVIHDALQVRRASGEQGLALKELLVKAGVTALPHQALGHKPLEVMVGSVIGVVAALLALSF